MLQQGTISPVNQTICSGATPTIITGVTTPTVNPAANVSYYWQASTDGFATFNNILSNTENYQHPTGILLQLNSEELMSQS